MLVCLLAKPYSSMRPSAVSASCTYLVLVEDSREFTWCTTGVALHSTYMHRTVSLRLGGRCTRPRPVHGAEGAVMHVVLEHEIR